MRTTVTLDADVEAIVRFAMRERGISFEAALNDAVRRGATPAAVAFRTPTSDMGTPAGRLTKACRWPRSWRMRRSSGSSRSASDRMQVVDVNVLHAVNAGSGQYTAADRSLDGALPASELVGFA